MLHALTKYSNIFVVLALALSSITIGCSGADEKRQAESLFVLAESAAQNGDYDRAIALLDSLDKTYPKQIENRRKGAHLRARTMEDSVRASLSDIDRRIALEQLKADSLSQFISKVDNPIEPYFVAKTMVGKSIVGNTGLESRMAPDGMFYLISSLKGSATKHEKIEVKSDGHIASTSVVRHDGERNDRTMGYEVIHFMEGECLDVAKFIYDYRNSQISVSFVGSGKPYSINLDSDSRDAIATLYEASQSILTQKKLQLERAKLEKQLQLLRNHAANTFEEHPKE